MSKILHIMVFDKFIPPFVDFIDQNFDLQEHLFMVRGKEKYGLNFTKEYPKSVLYRGKSFFKTLIEMNKAQKIILHGLWSRHTVRVLFLQPWLLKKCYWVMWGGDFYSPEKQSWMKKQVIKKMGHLVTYLPGDYALAQKWYGAEGTYNECLMYSSNVFRPVELPPKENGTLTIQIGNSAKATNNHLEVFEKLKPFKDEDIRLIVPLSYAGDKRYVAEVIEAGKKLFGDKFEPLTEFMPYMEYLNLLAQIDIAIFNYKRQQGMSNIIALLGLGKRVYLHHDITPYTLFKEIGVQVDDIEKLMLAPLDESVREKNKRLIQTYFSEENYIDQLHHIFED